MIPLLKLILSLTIFLMIAPVWVFLIYTWYRYLYKGYLYIISTIEDLLKERED